MKVPLPRFAGAPLLARLHVALRWRLFPFPALLSHTRASGDALDLGCGHGLFALQLALAHPGLAVHGVDPDEGKIRRAREASLGLPNLRFSVGRAEDVAEGQSDLVSLIDVLYLLPPAAQEGVLARAAAGLRPGGRLLVKEMSERPRWKALWNRGQELLSVRLLRVTRGRAFHFRPQAEWERLLTSLGLQVQVLRLDQGYLHPHVLFIAERPATAATAT